jgi:hypothetical protein
MTGVQPVERLNGAWTFQHGTWTITLTQERCRKIRKDFARSRVAAELHCSSFFA